MLDRTRLYAAALSAALIANSLATQASATAIGAPVVEDFEGYHPGTNILQHPDLGSFLIPGNLTAYTFKSGAILTQPIPNPGSRLGGFPEVQGVVLGDFALNAFPPNGAPFCFKIDCISSPTDLPSGTGYLAYNGLQSRGPVDFTFSMDVGLVGAFVTGVTPIRLTAFDSDGHFLTSESIDPVLAYDWDHNFLGLVSEHGIRSIRFEGDFFVMDDLTFAPLLVSEPSILLAFLLVLATLWVRRRQSTGGLPSKVADQP